MCYEKKEKVHGTIVAGTSAGDKESGLSLTTYILTLKLNLGSILLL